jgi:hypothetical protein
MKNNRPTYVSPESIIIALETEQYLLIGSGTGQNEGLYDDTNDYSDYFE